MLFRSKLMSAGPRAPVVNVVLHLLRVCIDTFSTSVNAANSGMAATSALEQHVSHESDARTRFDHSLSECSRCGLLPFCFVVGRSRYTTYYYSFQQTSNHMTCKAAAAALRNQKLGKLCEFIENAIILWMVQYPENRT